MRKGLLWTAFLAAVLMGLMIFAASLINDQSQTAEELQKQSQQLAEKAELLKEKEQTLAELQQAVSAGVPEDRELTDLQGQVAELEAQAAELEKQKAELTAEVAQLHADLEAMREELQSEESDQSYYYEVYNALTEGLNDVKGYISGN